MWENVKNLRKHLVGRCFIQRIKTLQNIPLWIFKEQFYLMSSLHWATPSTFWPLQHARDDYAQRNPSHCPSLWHLLGLCRRRLEFLHGLLGQKCYLCLCLPQQSDDGDVRLLLGDGLHFSKSLVALSIRCDQAGVLQKEMHRYEFVEKWRIISTIAVAQLPVLFARALLFMRSKDLS